MLQLCGLAQACLSCVQRRGTCCHVIGCSSVELICLIIAGAPYEAPSQTTFAAGDRIKVDLNPDVWKRLQEGHGGWNDIMASVSGKSIARVV